MAEPDNGKEVCDTAEERDCAPWQWGNLEKPPGWTGQSALRSYRGGRQRVSLHLGAHLLHTPPNLPPSPVFYYQGLSATSWNSKSGLFPQNKLSLLSSCSSEVQDVLRGASPRRTPINLYRRAWGEMGTEAQRTAGSVTLEESKYILFLKRNTVICWRIQLHWLTRLIPLVLLLLAHSTLPGSKAGPLQRQEKWKIKVLFKSEPAQGILKKTSQKP